MIQIIGFLICACLAVKLLEMSGNSALLDEDGKLRGTVALALVLGWASVFGFALWLMAQGNAFPETGRPMATGEVGDQLDCIDRAKTVEEVIDCSS